LDIILSARIEKSIRFTNRRLFGEEGGWDLEDAEVGKDKKGGGKADEENPIRFENTGGIRRKDFGHNEEQADCDANGLQRRQEQTITDGPDFDEQDWLVAEGINDDHTGEEEQDEKEPVSGFPGESSGDGRDADSDGVSEEAGPAG
jgi:hypothetical protein